MSVMLLMQSQQRSQVERGSEREKGGMIRQADKCVRGEIPMLEQRRTAVGGRGQPVIILHETAPKQLNA